MRKSQKEHTWAHSKKVHIAKKGTFQKGQIPKRHIPFSELNNLEQILGNHFWFLETELWYSFANLLFNWLI